MLAACHVAKSLNAFEKAGLIKRLTIWGDEREGSEETTAINERRNRCWWLAAAKAVRSGWSQDLFGRFRRHCVKERGLRCACKWKNGISSYGGDKDHREVGFWQGLGCRSLVWSCLRHLLETKQRCLGSWI